MKTSNSPGRVELPEIGPYLGRLIDLGRRFEAEDVDLDAIRIALVTDLFERAGAARGFLLTGDLGGAASALDRSTWLRVWQRAAESAASRVIDAIEGRLQRAAAKSGISHRRLGPLRPDSDDRAMLRAKCEAAGIPLEDALERSRESSEPWFGQVRRLAAALEDSWERLEAAVGRDLDEWTPRVLTVERWRPSRVPTLVVGSLLVGAAGWLGLALGGFLPVPAVLRPFAQWFWSLPWP